ncbi:hypothetical protein MDA_GLEAN10009500 [Myotis davidii]|uniref:Uncharacterized protein n=1 Tax=Myotis davidii TaxID=225400 RepID=L5M3A4_MYODS|nr:hypothetical protein MDA_GLEAN10009500 [Myotis davidii]
MGASGASGISGCEQQLLALIAPEASPSLPAPEERLGQQPPLAPADSAKLDLCWVPAAGASSSSGTDCRC